jgi:predicted ATP-binding protein involved in virulence
MRQPYRVESITLKDVGVFENTHIDFPKIKNEQQDSEKAEIHIFTGPNGCGKSTLLYALAGIFDKELVDSVILKKRFLTFENRVDFRFKNEDGFYGYRKERRPKDAVNYPLPLQEYHSYSRKYDEQKEYEFQFAAFAYSGHKTENDLFSVMSIEELTDSPFDDALTFENTVRPYTIAQWIATVITKAALARSDNDEDEALDYEHALKRVCRFIKDVCDISVSLHLNRKKLSVYLKVDDNDLDFDVLPDGLKFIFGWVADLALRLDNIFWKEQRDIFSQPIILFLDEVDIHLHPKWQRRILPAIQKLLPNAQVFVSTHSPFVVGSVEDAYVYRLPEHRRSECRDSSVAEVISAIDSKAGSSYQLILSDVFGIDAEFDVETEEQLAAFKRFIREHILTGQHMDTISELASELSDKGEELSEIVSLELRQMQRLLSKKQG